ncbi:hypothetical protein HMPREF3107_07775 [Neisseria sp. HMSC31F04]|uniref:DUF945 family protein n=1 Tax=Neisseria sp. HMSC31F04 TaxID=1581075 RepID=UPI0008A588D4|nr:DUF945 family protein [Neisseria sp. HMSC31F04]OFT00573.1 hypothetical protein HMPREF3107_07775 [Neisseria sp. HMSC31F04]
MKKTVIATLVGIAILGGGAVGGSVYADKKLKQDFYFQNNPKADKRLKITLKEFDMGVMSGKASWTGEFIPDLCHTEDKFSLRGEDVITRGLSGYNMKSKLYLVVENGKEFLLFNGDTDISWAGGFNSKLTAPASSYQNNEEGIKVTWDAVTSNISGGKADQRYYLSKFDFDSPSVSMQNIAAEEGKFLVQMNNLKYSTDTIMGQAVKPQNGTAIFSLGSFKVESPDFNLKVNNVKSESEQTIKDGKFTFASRNTIGDIEVNQAKFDRIQQNFSLQDLNGEAIERANAFLAREGQECLSAEQSQAEIKEIAKLLLKSGLKVDSKGNQIYLDGSMVKADADASLPPIAYENDQQLEQAVMEKLKYNAVVEVDKKFIEGILKLMAIYGIGDGSTDVEATVKELATVLDGEVTADKLIVKRSK